MKYSDQVIQDVLDLLKKVNGYLKNANTNTKSAYNNLHRDLRKNMWNVSVSDVSDEISLSEKILKNMGGATSQIANSEILNSLENVTFNLNTLSDNIETNNTLTENIDKNYFSNIEVNDNDSLFENTNLEKLRSLKEADYTSIYESSNIKEEDKNLLRQLEQNGNDDAISTLMLLFMCENDIKTKEEELKNTEQELRLIELDSESLVYVDNDLLTKKHELLKRKNELQTELLTLRQENANYRNLVNIQKYSHIYELVNQEGYEGYSSINLEDVAKKFIIPPEGLEFIDINASMINEYVSLGGNKLALYDYYYNAFTQSEEYKNLSKEEFLNMFDFDLDKGDIVDLAYVFMTGEERLVYDEIQKTRGNQAALGYLSAIEDSLNNRYGYELAKDDIKEFLSGNKTLESFGVGIETGVQGFFDNAETFFTHDTTTTWSEYRAMYFQTLLAQTSVVEGSEKVSREELNLCLTNGVISQETYSNLILMLDTKEKQEVNMLDISYANGDIDKEYYDLINRMMNNEEYQKYLEVNPGWYEFSFNLGSTTGNMLPAMAAGMFFGPVASNTMLFVSSAGGSYKEAIRSGSSEERALLFSYLNAGSEVALSYFLGKTPFLSKSNAALKTAANPEYKKGLVNLLKKFMGSDLVGDIKGEVLEEVLQVFVSANLKENITQIQVTNEEITKESWDSMVMAAASAILFDLPTIGFSIGGKVISFSYDQVASWKTKGDLMKAVNAKLNENVTTNIEQTTPNISVEDVKETGTLDLKSNDVLIEDISNQENLIDGLEKVNTIFSNYGDKIIKILENIGYGFENVEKLQDEKYLYELLLDIVKDDVLYSKLTDLNTENLSAMIDKLRSSESLFNTYISEENFKEVILFDSSFLTEEVIKNHNDKIFEVLGDEIPINQQNNKYLLSACLSENKLKLIPQFDGECFTRDIIEKYSDLVFESLKNSVIYSWKMEKPFKQYNSRDLFELAIEKRKYAWLVNFDATFLNEDFIKLNNELITNVVSVIKIIPIVQCRNQNLLTECLKTKRFDLVFKFDSSILTEDVIKVYGDDIIKNLNNDIPSSQTKNKSLLDECLERKRFDLVFKFDSSILTEDIIKVYGGDIIESLNGIIPRQQRDNKSLLNECLERKRFDLVLGFNGSILTEDIIKVYGDDIIKNLNNDIPSSQTKNKSLLNECLERKRFDLVFKFDSSILTEDIIKVYGDDIILSMGDILKESLSDNEELFNFCLDKKKFDLLVQFDKRLLTDEIIERYSEDIIRCLSDFVPSSLEKRETAFNICLKRKRFDLALKFDEKLLTKEVIELYSDDIINIIKDGLEYNQANNKYLFEECLKKGEIQVAFDFNKTLFTHDLVDKYWNSISKFLENSDVHLDFFDNDISESKSIINKCLNKQRFDLLVKWFKLETEVLDKYTEQIISAIGNEISIIQRSSNNLFEKYLDLKRFDLMVQFENSILTQDIVEKYSLELIDALEKTSKTFLSDNEILFQTCLDNNRYDLILKFDNKIINEFIIENKGNISKQFFDALNIETSYELFKYKLEYLYNRNDEIAATIDLKILDKKYDCIGMNVLERMVLHKNIQELLLNLDNNQLIVFSKILNLMDLKHYDLTGVIENILLNIKKYDLIFQNINIDELTSEQLKNLTMILQYENNVYNIENFEDLKNDNFLIKKRAYFEKYDKIAVSGVEEELSNIEEFKDALLLKKYGLSSQMVEFICERYCFLIEELQNSGLNENILNIINSIYDINKTLSFEKLRYFYLTSSELETSFDTFAFLESAIRKEYAKMYSETLYKPKEVDKSQIEKVRNVTYNGQKIDFYEVNGDFNMQIHALGAYRDWTRPDNFKTDWLRPKIAHHGICTSYIGNNQIATTRVKHPILGFSSYESSALLVSGNYDLLSDEANFCYSTSYKKPYTLLPPSLMINSTRHGYNEMVLERRINDYYSESSLSFKRTPDYVIYIVDDINDQYNFSNANSLYNETLQAAADFGVPIVIVDRLKYAQSEMEMCKKLENELYSNMDVNTLKTVFLKYMSNNVGCRQIDEKHYKYHEIFADSVVRDFYNRIVEFVINKELDTGKSLKLIDKLYGLLEEEKTKYDVAHKYTKLEPPLFLDYEMQRLSEIKDEIINEIEEII